MLMEDFHGRATGLLRAMVQNLELYTQPNSPSGPSRDVFGCARAQNVTSHLTWDKIWKKEEGMEEGV